MALMDLGVTQEDLEIFQAAELRLGTVVGVAVEVKENGTKVLENERLRNGLCRLRLQRYGKAPEVPAGVPVDVTVMRWTDEELPIHYLYAFWMDET